MALSPARWDFGGSEDAYGCVGFPLMPPGDLASAHAASRAAAEAADVIWPRLFPERTDLHCDA